VPGRALAQTTPEQKAEQMAAEGLRLAGESKPRDAILHYEKALATSPQWRYAYNLGRLYEAIAEPVTAHRYYVQARRLPCDAQQKAKAMEATGLVEARLVRLGYARVELVITPPDATVVVDGDTVEVGDGARVRWLKAGPHRLVVAARGFVDLAEIFDVKEAGELRVVRGLKRPADEPVAVDPRPKALKPRLDPPVKVDVAPAKSIEPKPQSQARGPWPWVVGGAGLAATAVGVAYLLKGVSDANDSLDLPGKTVTQVTYRRDRYDYGANEYVVGLVATGVGAAALGVAAWLFVSPSNASRAGGSLGAGGLSVSLRPARDGGSIVVDWGF